MKPIIATPAARPVDVKSRACRIAITFAANCQIAAMKKNHGPMPGINPATFNIPGDWANPKVRAIPNLPPFQGSSIWLFLLSK